ncbi:hypothetical protein A4X13_0g4663 [Tilletia indica]|uniref:Uncharacterized protein n=1 Tax=Tilletia indica TaxID=43049 RepID=A0A177TM01_9BASI|nr:hypothetical protein A4X13_0g4663 [Tilletia indica]
MLPSSPLHRRHLEQKVPACLVSFRPVLRSSHLQPPQPEPGPGPELQSQPQPQRSAAHSLARDGNSAPSCYVHSSSGRVSGP